MQPQKIRVLVADDSAVVRKMLTESVGADPEIEVIGAGRHGAEAVQLYKLYRPDVVILDVEMPVMDGVEAVQAIREINSHQPIIMFSSITTRGGQATLDALAAGANDYVTKPSGLASPDKALSYIRAELIPRIKLWGRRASRTNIALPQQTLAIQTKDEAKSTLAPHRLRSCATPADKRKSPSFINRRIDIVAIGVSTGGPNALAELLLKLPGDFPVPIVIVQHMPALFTQLLAERLDSVCALHVREGKDRVPLHPGDVWLAPGDYHMTVAQQLAERVLRVSQESPENSCRPSVDPLFRSVANIYGSHVLAIILTGMGRDGELGCKAVKQAGGAVIAQDESSSVVWGMPRAIAQAGLADAIHPLAEMAPAILDRIGFLSGEPLAAAVR